MIKWSRFYCMTVFFVWLVLSDAEGQTTYFMGNQTIRECEGILRDSEENEDFPGYYDHNEDYVTTICVENAAEIILTFTEFHIEEDFDFMYIYEGPDLSGNLLATYTGFGIPPSIAITDSDCVTIRFTSDDNVAQFGWTLRWEVETEEPEPIDITPVADYSCEEPSFLLQLNAPVLCDSLNPRNLFLAGPGNAAVQSVTAINCTDGITDQFQINFNPVISIGGNYQLRLIAYFRDACDEIHELISSYDFVVNDCPIEIEFIADSACPGECMDITAEVTGGDGNYTYFWTPASGSNSANINVCPQEGDTISLRVVDGLGATAMAQFNPEFFPEPVLLNIPSDTICRLRNQFNLRAEPPGGTWSANGIHPNNKSNGLYQAWRNRDNPITIDQITYTDTNGCTVDTQMAVLFISVGNNDAECIDAPPFQVSGGVPAGGVWSGNGIDASGVFTPDQTGQYYVEYEAPNGCIWGKNVFVSDEIVLNGPDTVCNTQGNFRIDISPPGGKWDDNPAIWRHGDRVDINRSQLGDNQLIYRSEGGGCADTFNYYVKRITLDNNNRTYCPDILGDSLAIPFVPNIPGGQWQGGGIIDPVAGTINVSNASAGDTYDLRYVADGCFVDATINMVVPNIDLIAEDTYCKSDAPILLEDLVNFSPDYAVLSGLSVLDDGNGNLNWDPSLGAGDTSFVRVDAHGCADSVSLYFHPTSEIVQNRFCQLDPPEYLDINPSFTSATGPGIVFPDLALFDASELDTGWVYIELQSEEGCINIDSIYITGRVEPGIESFQPYYCYKDTIIAPVVDPPGGRIWLDDQPVQNFNPTLLDEGGHVLRYDYGDGNCETTVSTSFFILPSLDLEAVASVDTLCPGELVRLSAQPSGGDPSGDFNITWGNELGFGQVHYTSPSSPQMYVVAVEDGCSEPASDSVFIEVHPDFQVDLNYGPRVCSDQVGRVEIEVNPDGSYDYFKNGLPIGETYTGLAENFELLVEQDGTGCIKRLPVEMPSYPPISANFNLFPSGCINTYKNKLKVSDLSMGAMDGYWLMNGEEMKYFPGDNMELLFDSSGIYDLQLVVVNEGGCIDSLTREICVEPFSALQVPNAFTPNGDGVNDEFQFHAIGIEEIHWMIYDRYGRLLFESFNIDDSWDGQVDGQPGPVQNYLLVMNYTDLKGNSESARYNLQLVR